jgi:hypothetical protein
MSNSTVTVPFMASQGRSFHRGFGIHSPLLQAPVNSNFQATENIASDSSWNEENLSRARRSNAYQKNYRPGWNKVHRTFIKLVTFGTIRMSGAIEKTVASRMLD